ncbi:OLC1v1031610C1 [Oldenlandia corymbosa var. corymbosa]|uniref:OLC1v1031610C1 n=1 Tax=Oldenlandia corymbosa var. corymbosa TaxID=529605 RepID=A0AAV1CIZ1_OLDCO|nr:OLC1v1031610C1 [Oldenlandia corymbosa var. corymbosa]
MAQFGSQYSLLLLGMMVAVVVARMSPSPNNPQIAGGFQKANPKDPGVVDAGEFAIQEHNRIANTKLQFVAVFRAEQQVVDGTNFILLIEARKENGVNGLYQARVFRGLKVSGGKKTLEGFIELPRASA